MASSKLGKVETLELKNVLSGEARNFTPWLSKPDGLALLGDAIGAKLELVEMEKKIGPFSADLLTRVIDDPEHLVVVENQYSKTNHDHLGKLITYASGLRARTVIWIAENFQDEHRQALEWLNENAGSKVRFLGLEVAAIKIGNSQPALQLQPVISPNVWDQAVQESREEGQLSEIKLEQLRFWEEVREFVLSRQSKLRMRKPAPQHWYDISIGTANAHIALTASPKYKRVGCELYMPGAKAKQVFDQLHVRKRSIEKQFRQSLDWQLLEGRQACRIALYKDGSIQNADQRQKLIKWLYATAERFYKVFAPQLQNVDI